MKTYLQLADELQQSEAHQIAVVILYSGKTGPLAS